MQFSENKVISILDISNDGNMDSKYARLFNKVADGIQRDYVNCVNDLSLKHKYNLHWLVTPFVGRNIFICNVYEDVAKIIFVKSILEKNILIDVVIVETPIIKKVLKSFLPDTVKVKSKQSNLKYYYFLLSNIVTGLIKYIISSLFRHISYRLATLYSANKPYTGFTEPVSVIETLIYKNSFETGEFNDRHFCNINTYLEDAEVSRVIYIPMFYRLFNYFSTYLSAFKSKINFLFIDEFISLSDIFYPVIHPFRLNYSQSNIKIADVDISHLVNHSLIRHSTNTSSLYAILKYRFCNNLRDSNAMHIGRVIRWYENQEVDRGSIMGWRSYSQSLNVIGYMGYFSPRNYLSTYPIQIEYECKIVPDCIGVMGEGLINQHKRFCESLNIEVVPSFRFAVPRSQVYPNRKKNKEIKILVTLPIQERHIKILMNIIGGMSSDNCAIPIEFIIKPHPASQFSYSQSPSDHNNVRYIITEDSLPALFEDVDFVMSSSSSTLVEAIMYGKYTVLVSPTQNLRLNVIPNIVPNNLWGEVFSTHELSKIIDKQTYLHGCDVDTINNLNSMLVGLEPNNKNVTTFLGI